MNTTTLMCSIAFALWLPVASAQEATPERTDTEEQQRQEMRKEVDEAVGAIRSYSIERRKEAVAQARQAMEEADRRTAQFEARVRERWNHMDTATRQRSLDTMADLRQRRNELGEWSGGMKHSSKEAWGDVKSGFVRSYHDFIDALEQARTQDDKQAEQDLPPGDKTSSQKQQEQER
jgi:hypothetical protein